MNDKMLEMYQVSRDEALDLTIKDDYSSGENKLELLSVYWDNVNQGKAQHFEWIAKRPHTGKKFPVQVHLDKIFIDQKEVVLATVNDVTILKKIEEELRQSQKMEVIGNLAGGLAHDFNNILAGIVGTLSILEHKLNNDVLIEKEKMLKYIKIMTKSGDRASDLVTNLLTLSRKQPLEFISIDLNTIVENIIELGKNTFHKQVIFDIKRYPEPAYVMADVTQLNQVLLNFCLNADHAMTIMRDSEEEWGGTLSISIDRVSADDVLIANRGDVVDKYYYIISVRDTGVGIDEDIIQKIFNPFFSTKDKSKGTGLGLSMVYNIIKQHKGFIDVKSEKGVGTVFDLFLPVYQQVEPVFNFGNTKKYNVKEEGLILIIDDEDIIHNIAKDILIDCGYNTISAFNGVEGIKIYKDRIDDISAVILDMSMPEMSGKETFLKLKEVNPDIKVLLSSGFRLDERVEKVMELGVNAFLQKPFTYKKLSAAISTVLRG